ncbi:hypothetical protein B0H16DRAFT_1769971 [Mycena metata]|uniref:Uncharacterized protein n=1 Tax=Mycena metata TaxID=1033252 RepID=A0AAD7I1C1_9AGAR|nr:hypothetical protein B0H16DRAFT_1769971 [Mycena metata]
MAEKPWTRKRGPPPSGHDRQDPCPHSGQLRRIGASSPFLTPLPVHSTPATTAVHTAPTSNETVQSSSTPEHTETRLNNNNAADLDKSTTPTVGCAQNADGSLKDAADIDNAGFAPAAAAAVSGLNSVFTLPPPGGFPHTNGLDDQRLQEGIADRQQIKWNSAEPSDKFYVYPWNATRHSTGSTIIEDLKSAIFRVCGTSPLIGPAEAATNARQGLPFVYLVKKLPAADIARLTAGICWNTPGFTFFAVPYTPEPSTWLMTLDGLLFTAGEGVDVATLVADVVCNCTDTTTFLSLTNDNYPAGVNPVTHFRSSIRIFPISLQNPGGESSHIAWNIHAAPPPCTSSSNRAWISLLNGLNFDSKMHYVGHAILPPLLCSGCKSSGHIIDLCTFPSTSGKTKVSA